MPKLMITGNATSDGRAVYLATDNGWADEPAGALVIEEMAVARKLLASAKQGDEARVCDPYVIKLKQTPDGLVPNTLREEIRASGGPTIEHCMADRRA